jgi:rhodanese-related sulfurtransferase
MTKSKMLLFLSGFILLISTVASAQVPVVTAEEVRSWIDGKKKFVLIDARPAEEYQQGHIAGAINIPPDRMKTEASVLPKDKATALIFYCRGAG